MKKEPIPCPYKSLPDTAYWRRSVTKMEPKLIDPIVNPKFKIAKKDGLATAGSCFAQHISRYMRSSGFNYYIAEQGHSILSEETSRDFNYGTFSARYGNIYTTRQLLQTFQRAYGLYAPVDDCWEEGDAFIDPYRPYIQPGGFATREEFEADRLKHFEGIRKTIEEADVFVFTLGLTEMWQNILDGAAYPICPGCGVGEHNPEIHKFHNLTVDEVVKDLECFIELAHEKNPNLKILLTVSPVPLIATMEPRHILSSTAYSKSVLRVAAQMIIERYDHVDYFPSYEIITSNFSRGRYFEDDLREVKEEGVNHAMSCFFRHYLDVEIDRLELLEPHQNEAKESLSERINKVICDEERLDEEL